MRKIVVCLFLLFVCANAFAQEVYDGQEMYVPFEDDFRDIVVDTTLYYNTLSGRSGIFRSLSQYGFSFVSYRNRGVDERFSRVAVAGIELSSGIGEYPDYGMYTALGSSVGSVEYNHYDFPVGLRSPVFSEIYDIRASSAPAGYAATYVFSQKRYGTGLRFRAAGGMGRGWDYALSVRGRWGRDAYVKGVFTDAVTASLAVDKKFRRGAVLSVFVLAAPQERGMKGWTEDIVYQLTGNNLYNPYWGWFNGKVRNARVNRDFTPMVVASLDIPGGKGRNRYAVAAAYRFGERSRSGLTWFGGANPTPDYYTNLPNHRTEPQIIERLTQAWRSRDERVTQIDWRGLYETNMFSADGTAKYIQEERVEALDNIQLSFSGRSTAKDGFGYAYGARVRSDRSNFSHRVRDMLGAGYVPNRDPFSGVESDMRNPGRKVTVGDVFDYDYDITRREAALYGCGQYRSGRWNVSLNVEFAAVSWERNGHYEKYGLPGAISFGSSGAKEFSTYNVSLAGRYFFTAGHHLSASLLFGDYAPQYEHIFLSPDYSNTFIASPKPVSLLGLNVDYRLPISYFAEVEISGYVMRSSGESDVTGYYDDIYGVYSVLVLENIRKINWGLEAGVKVNATEKLSVTAGMSVGNYSYSGGADFTIYEDANQRIMTTGEKADLDGFIHTATPQLLVSINATYSFQRQWRLEVEWAYADRRYVSINPLRRTDRVASLMPSSEMLADCVNQERLPSASVFNVGVTKGFNLAGARFFVSLSVNNIFGRNNIIYGGYEPMRLEKSKALGSIRYKPFPARYNYSYPRTILASLTCSF